MVPFRALVLGDPAALPIPNVWELRHWRGIDVAMPGPFAGRPLEAIRLGLASFDTSPLLWADALVVAGTPDGVSQALIDAIAADPSLLRRRALISGGDLAGWANAVDSGRARERVALREADAVTAGEIATRPSSTTTDPLVSIILAVDAEPADLIDRAVGSVGGTQARFEVVVAGGPRPSNPDVRWVPAAGGWSERYTAAVDAARGEWIAPIDPGSVFAEGHIATLLDVALEHEFDVVYGQSLLVDGGEVVGVAGDWPPSAASLAHDAVLYRSALRGVRPDPGCAAEGEDPRWNLWRRWLEIGSRIANVEEPVTLRDLSAGAIAVLGDAA